MKSKILLVTLGVIAIATVAINLDFLTSTARQSVASVASKAAIKNLSGVMADNNARGFAAAELITLPINVTEVARGIYKASGVGNTYVITTSAGYVVFDTGLVIQAAEQKQKLQAVIGNSEPANIILSHSHADHVGGARFWSEGNAQLIAHEEFEEEQRYLTELNSYLHGRNRTLFPWLPETPRTLPGMDFRGLEPDILVDNDVPFRFTLGDRRFEVHAAPGAEGADNIVLWLPDDKVLLSGDFFGPQFPQFPNIFTMRGEKVRKPVEYSQSIGRLLEFDIETLLPSHLEPIQGADTIRAGMTRIRDAVDFVHDQTVAGMNAGRPLETLMRDIVLPERLALSQTHGKVSWAVKSIWEYYATWFHFDRTSELYATSQSTILRDLAGVLDQQAALSLVQSKIDDNRPEQALLLVELLEGIDDATALSRLRLHVLQQLKDVALQTGNDYELYWLDSEIEKAHETARLIK